MQTRTWVLLPSPILQDLALPQSCHGAQQWWLLLDNPPPPDPAIPSRSGIKYLLYASKFLSVRRLLPQLYPTALMRTFPSSDGGLAFLLEPRLHLGLKCPDGVAWDGHPIMPSGGTLVSSITV